MKVALAAALVAILTGVGTQAAQNGQIAFSRHRFTNSPSREEIWIANPDGTGLKQLTQAPPNFLDSGHWAPNGSRLVFTRCAPRNGEANDGRCTIWAVNPGGGAARQLSRCRVNAPNVVACPDENTPVYSRDGQHLAFLRYTGVLGIAISDPAALARIAPRRSQVRARLGASDRGVRYGDDKASE